jgi:hypothetical protein
MEYSIGIAADGIWESGRSIIILTKDRRRGMRAGGGGGSGGKNKILRKGKPAELNQAGRSKYIQGKTREITAIIG